LEDEEGEFRWLFGERGDRGLVPPPPPPPGGDLLLLFDAPELEPPLYCVRNKKGEGREQIH